MAAFTDEIHHLAKSLTTKETEHFYPWLLQHKIAHAKTYQKMLELLQKQSEYNEPLLLQQLRKPVITRNYSYHKTIVTGYIIDSVTAFNAPASTQHKINHLLESTLLLYDRRLYPQAKKVLDKARKEALHYEKLYLLLQIAEIERKLLKQQTPKNLKKELAANTEEKKAIWKKIETEEIYTNFNDTVFALYLEHNRIKDGNIPPELSAVINHQLLQSPQAAPTFDSQLKYHQIHALYAQLTGKCAIALEHREAMAELWNKHPHLISEMPVRYRFDLSALLSMRHENNRYDGFEELIARIENVKAAGSASDDAGIFREVYYLRQLYLLNTNKWQQALELIPKIEKYLKQHEKSIGESRLYSFWYNIAVTCFITGNYKACQPWVEKLRAIIRTSAVRTDLRDFAGILLLILYYETGKHQLVEFNLRNAKDRLKKGNKLFEFEKITLHFLGKLLAANNNANKIKEIRKQFPATLQQLSLQQGKQSLLGLDEIIIWAKQKVV